MPRFNHRDGRKRDYLRGFGMQFWGCGAKADAGFAKALPGFGADFKRAVKKRYPALVALHPYGEVLPYADNRVTVENSPVDRYGVPIARIEYKYRENERQDGERDVRDRGVDPARGQGRDSALRRGVSGHPRAGDSRACDLPHGAGSEAVAR